MVLIDEEDEILYQSNDVCFIKRNEELVLIINNKTYYITSNPYEPCLYIKLNDKIISIIHNSFNTDEIENIARENNKIRSITGREYDIKEVCELLVCAINNNIYDTDISYIEKKLSNKIKSNIKELTDDIFYKEYKKYSECVLDYCIIKMDSKYNVEESHKEAVIFAMSRWKDILKDEYDMDITYDSQKMVSNKLESKKFFEVSSENTKDDNIKPYCFLFLNPPHGCSYTVKDFKYINNILFPNGYEELEIFEWSTNWSNYFEDGLEWWGARCVSIYDNTMDRFVIIGASATD